MSNIVISKTRQTSVSERCLFFFFLPFASPTRCRHGVDTPAMKKKKRKRSMVLKTVNGSHGLYFSIHLDLFQIWNQRIGRKKIIINREEERRLSRGCTKYLKQQVIHRSRWSCLYLLFLFLLLLLSSFSPFFFLLFVSTLSFSFCILKVQIVYKTPLNV